MTFTYEPTTGATRDLVRLAIGDTDDVTAAKQIYEDAELDMLINTYGDDVNTVAGHAMMGIASSRARLATMCSIGNRDFVTDRKAVAKECREQAKTFFTLAGETLSATEVALEDKDLTQMDGFGHDQWNHETALDELND